MLHQHRQIIVKLVKLSQVREVLLQRMAIKEMADQLGYSSVPHFTTAFRKQFGITPAKII